MKNTELDWHLLVNKKSGEACVVASLNGVDLSQFKKPVKLEGPLQPHQRIVDGKVVDDLSYKIDTEFGESHIRAARDRKLMEALMISSGYKISGLLQKEADKRGCTVEELASLVLEKSSPLADKELERIERKLDSTNKPFT